MKRTVIIFTMIVLLCGMAYAQKLLIGISPGLSLNLGGGFDYWKSGFGGSAHFLYHLSPQIAVGARFGYSSVTPNGEPFVGYTSAGHTFTSIDRAEGSGSVFEMMGSFRFYPTISSDRTVCFFGQAGVGYYIMKVNYDEIAGPGRFDTWMGSGTCYLTISGNIERERKSLGLNLGGGLSVRAAEMLRLEMLPLIHILFTEGGTTLYLGFGLGISFVPKT